MTFLPYKLWQVPEYRLPDPTLPAPYFTRTLAARGQPLGT
jgi:hypothetical protein